MGVSLASLFCFCAPGAAAQVAAPVKQWDRTLGGNQDDALRRLRPTPDGGYILAGISLSGTSGDKSQPALGFYDYWIVKVDANGHKQWERSFGGPSEDDLRTVRLTADGGYLLAGFSWSGAEGDKSEPNHGVCDYWVIKLDAAGNKQWDRSLGGRDVEYLSDAIQTKDGGYLLAGRSESEKNGTKSQASLGVSDMWVVKLDAAGRTLWDRAYGTTDNDYLSSVQQTRDGGYILGGYTYGKVSVDKSQPSRGETDYWLVKIDEDGNKQWDRSFGGASFDEVKGVQQTTDGGYILGGWSTSGASADKSEPSAGVDFWIVKTDAAGTRQWDRTVQGGSVRANYLQEIQQTTDGGYVAGGESFTENPVSPTQGTWNYWLVKLSATGAQQWDQSYSGGGSDNLQAVQQTPDGGYLLGGTSRSGQAGDKSEPSKGGADFWIVKVGEPRISGDFRLCQGGQVQLLAPAGARSYLWNTGATSSQITVTQPGTYTVLVTYPSGQAVTLQQQVSAFIPPPPVITGDSLMCSGQAAKFTASSAGAISYLWNTGTTTPFLSVKQPGVYTVVASFGNGCTSSARWRVRERTALPTFTLGPDTTLCEGETLLLHASASLAGAAYQWSDGTTASTLAVQQPGRYALQQTTLCGSYTAYRQVSYRSCVRIPNIITPNNDQINDRFEALQLPPGKWELTVYTRWGTQIAHMADYRNDWGAQAAAGVYYYWLHEPASGRTYKGWVEVVR